MALPLPLPSERPQVLVVPTSSDPQNLHPPRCSVRYGYQGLIFAFSDAVLCDRFLKGPFGSVSLFSGHKGHYSSFGMGDLDSPVPSYPIVP